MLNDQQITDLWERMLAAEIRTAYYAMRGRRCDLWRKTLLLALFFLSITAAGLLTSPATLRWIPFVCTVSALGLGIAYPLERRATVMRSFESDWRELAKAYRDLWERTWRADAAAEFATLIARDRQVSASGMIEDPSVDWALLRTCQHRVVQSRA